jgi:hypothetical protein
VRIAAVAKFRCAKEAARCLIPASALLLRNCAESIAVNLRRESIERNQESTEISVSLRTTLSQYRNRNGISELPGVLSARMYSSPRASSAAPLRVFVRVLLLPAEPSCGASGVHQSWKYLTRRTGCVNSALDHTAKNITHRLCLQCLCVSIVASVCSCFLLLTSRSGSAIFRPTR